MKQPECAPLFSGQQGREILSYRAASPVSTVNGCTSKATFCRCEQLESLERCGMEINWMYHSRKTRFGNSLSKSSAICLSIPKNERKLEDVEGDASRFHSSHFVSKAPPAFC